MARRKYVDWDSIEPLYRAGFLSLSKICDQYRADHVHSQVWKQTITHAAILKKAKQKKWSRNLAKKVTQRIKEKLVTDLVTDCNQRSDDEIIEQAAAAGTQVVVRHRKEILVLLKHEDMLLLELGSDPKKLHFASYQGAITSKRVNLTVMEKSVTLKNLVAVRAQRIALERQVHGLDEAGAAEDPVRNLADSELDQRIKVYEAKMK